MNLRIFARVLLLLAFGSVSLLLPVRVAHAAVEWEDEGIL